MGNFNRGNNRGGGQNFGGRSSGRSQMHDAVCKECGNDCQVPFRPTGNKPIYCSDCFENQGGGSKSSGFGEKRFDRRDSRPRQMHKATCDKCGSSCELPFRPTAGKPVYCNNCFGKSGDRDRTGNKGGANISKQIENLNYKLDKIMQALDIPQPKKKEAPRQAQDKKEKKSNKDEVSFDQPKTEPKKTKAKAKSVAKKTAKKAPAKKKTAKKVIKKKAPAKKKAVKKVVKKKK